MKDERDTIAEDAGTSGLAALADSLKDCSGCGLAQGRTQVVFGSGNADAELMFVGEGPGFHEDRQGEPFVGQAGKLLTELLGGIGLSRQDVYIANVVKCRPPENRDPTPAEIAACSAHLFKQIRIIRPRVICTLGRFATKLLADTELSMTAIHGRAKERTLAGVPVLVFPVFHPAAALYTPANRQVLEEDFSKLRVLLTKGVEALGSKEIATGERSWEDHRPLWERLSEDSESSPSSGEQLPLW
jgi:uracil-DNA glycosylase family 4